MVSSFLTPSAARSNGSGNGRVRDPETLGGIPGVTELGTALSEGLYSLDGTVYDYKDPTVRDLDRAFDIDPQLQALEYAITLPLRSAPRSIVPTKGDRGEAELCRSNLLSPDYQGGMTTQMDTIIAQMAGGIFRRRAHFEKVFKIVDGKALYHKLAFRPATSCEMRVDDNGSFNGFRQRAISPNGRFVEEDFDPKKAFVFINDDARRPVFGCTIAQTAYRSYVDKQKVLRLYFLHLQNVALASIKGEYEGPEGKAGTDALARKLQKIRGGGVVALGPGETASFFEGGRAGNEFREALRYIDGQMAGSMLVRFLQLGTDSNQGSWSLSRDHSDFFLMSLEAKLKEFAEALTNYVLAPLVYYNFGPDAAYPVVMFERLSDTARDQALKIWESLMTTVTYPNIHPKLMRAITMRAMPSIDIDYAELERDGATIPKAPPRDDEAEVVDTETDTETE